MFERLQRMTASDPAELASLCREYLAGARVTLAELRNAVLRRQGEEVRSRAHYLKGSSFIIGARAVSRCCEKLEDAARKCNFADGERLLEDTAAAIDSVAAALAKRFGPAVLPGEGPAA
jgi:HPt (histidine-containing phosphotransfer) domain-containing protein